MEGKRQWMNIVKDREKDEARGEEEEEEEKQRSLAKS